jgi:hypothetical protein
MTYAGAVGGRRWPRPRHGPSVYRRSSWSCCSRSQRRRRGRNTPANPEATDPHHIYVHPGEPGYNPNWANDMPTPDPSQLYLPASPAVQEKSKEVGAVINSPDFEPTRQQWESALGMRISMLGAVYMRDGSLVFQVGVESQGEPIPDVLPHTFVDLPVEVREMTIRPATGVGSLAPNPAAP